LRVAGGAGRADAVALASKAAAVETEVEKEAAVVEVVE